MSTHREKPIAMSSLSQTTLKHHLVVTLHEKRRVFLTASPPREQKIPPPKKKKLRLSQKNRPRGAFPPRAQPRLAGELQVPQVRRHPGRRHLSFTSASKSIKREGPSLPNPPKNKSEIEKKEKKEKKKEEEKQQSSKCLLKANRPQKRAELPFPPMAPILGA